MSTNIQGLLQQVVELIEKKNPIPNNKPATSGFQAPIKGSYFNSGNFSPNAPTDARHKKHDGVDLRASGGTPIYPIAAGTVTSVGSDPKGGNIINIQHINGVRAYYAHLGSVTVNKGDKVNLNTVIGTVGDSGNAQGTFPHLHIQIWQNGQLMNPAKFFHVPQYTNVTTKEKAWISDQAKIQAKNFNMKQHIQNKKLANRIDHICKLAELLNNHRV